MLSFGKDFLSLDPGWPKSLCKEWKDKWQLQANLKASQAVLVAQDLVAYSCEQSPVLSGAPLNLETFCTGTKC